MNEEKFWEIIESSGNPKDFEPKEHCEEITSKLTSMSEEQIVSFSNIHREVLVKAYTWSMIKACYVLLGYVSDDVFEDFINWVILNGKDNFYKTITNPDYLASYIQVDDPVEEVTGEPLLYVCEEAWQGDVEELEEQYVYPAEPEINDELPEIEALIKEFPRIHENYGTLDRT